MKMISSLPELKKELETRDRADLIKIALRLSKHKIENKELLDYVLFHSEQPLLYAENLKELVNAPFDEVFSHPYGLAKRMRKSLRIVSKYYRFTGSRQGELDLMLAFMNRFFEVFRPNYRAQVLFKLLSRCLVKMEDQADKLHEDLQGDYLPALEDIRMQMQEFFGDYRV